MTKTAVIIGASGGLGGALADALDDEGLYDKVIRLSRSANGDAHIDIGDEASIKQSAERLKNHGVEPILVIVATGLLHDGENGPEKSLSELDMGLAIKKLRGQCCWTSPSSKTFPTHYAAKRRMYVCGHQRARG